jgi:hypothetical protein
MVGLISVLTFLEAKQKRRFRPRSCLVPIGNCLFWHRLWKERLLGCKEECVVFVRAELKLDCKEAEGLANRPYALRQC